MEELSDGRLRTFGLLLEAQARLTRLFDRLLRDSAGISLQTFEVLLRIARSDGGRVTMSELAGAVALTTGGVTRLADRLEMDGLVRRAASGDDRRVVHLVLTAQGQRVLATAVRHHLEDLDEHLAARIDPADLQRFERVLDTLRRDPPSQVVP